jgi:membrane associated rhomboid family serine protease
MRSRHARPGLLHEQWPLLLVLLVLTLLRFAQALGPTDWDLPFMVVPEQIEAAWRDLRAGAADGADLAELGTLLSCAFLHGDLEHLVFNALYLWIFAGLAIRHLGRGWFVLIYVFTAIAGSVVHVVLDPARSVPTLGASGAVLGFEGLYLGLALRFQLEDPEIWPMAHPIPPVQLAAIGLIGLAFDFHGVFSGNETFIAHGAHIGGFLGGLLIAALLPGRALR